MNDFIKVTVNGAERTVRAGSFLSEIVNGEKPCGGHGKCGKCKVIARGELSEITDAERELLSEAELARGVRLACLTVACGACTVETIGEADEARILTDSSEVGVDIAPSFEKYGVAIDIGTTTLAARLYGKDGALLAECSRLNPQSEFGADVISRIEAALAGKADQLADTVRAALDGMTERLALSASIDVKEIDSFVITGNTVMLSLLAREDVEPFSHAPFDAKRLFGETLTAAELGLVSAAPDAAVYLPPCISAFVGADTVCALTATALCERECAMLVDIGTNGEMALWNNGRLTVCSTAAGPAFEGVGISMGMRGSSGAIDKVIASEGKLLPHVIGGGSAVGICGSGLVDAAAAMLELEIIDETGFLEDDPFPLTEEVSLSAKDIRMLQLAKSAICAGLQTLTQSAGVEPDGVRELFIAGGFGHYLNKENAAKIGLLPQRLAEISKAVGNAALGGASMLLLNSCLRETAESMAADAETLELSTSPIFSEQFMLGMMFEEI